jgi:pimeloyl-ACP methyl ester carboxylesterase
LDPVPHLNLISANHQQLAVWDWPGEDPPFLFAHATGFHGRCWDRIIQEFPGRHSMALDSRGHGRSSRPDPPCLWRDFGRDLAAVAEHLNVRSAIGIGHSMGGHLTVQAAALRPETYGALLLLDPTILPRQYYGTERPDAGFTLRRRDVWSSPAEMFDRFRDRPPFARWQPGILRDYCDYGLLPNGSEYVLACPPSIEASIYWNSNTHESNIYPDIARIGQPVVVMRAGTVRIPGVFDLGASPTAVDLASNFARSRDTVLPECSHYIPMERPDRVIEEIRQLLQELLLVE